MMYFSASVLGSISLLLFNPNGGVKGRSTVVRRPRRLDDHQGNCHGDPVCDECTCEDDGVTVTCENPFADLAIYECHEGEVEGIGCHCDGNTIHCDGMDAVHSEDEDSHSSHDDDCHCDGDMPHCKVEADEAEFDCSGEDHDDHDDHEGDCHCDGDTPHCEDEADEAAFVCDGDDHEGDGDHFDEGDCHCDGAIPHCKVLADEADFVCDGEDHDHDKEGIDEANYYCVAGDIHGMPKDCMIDTEYLHKGKPGKDCMNFVPKNPTKHCKNKKIMKKCAGICNSLRCQNTKGTEYCRDYAGKLKAKYKDANGKKKKKNLNCQQIKEKGLCKKKYKDKTKFFTFCPVQCNACLMMEM